MNEDCLIVLVLISILLLKSREVVDEGCRKNIKHGVDLFDCWRYVGLEIDFLIAESLVYLSNLVSVVEYVPHDIFVETHLIRQLFDFLQHISLLFEQLSKEISKDIDASEYLSIVSFHNEFLVNMPEVTGFCSHLLNVLRFLVTLFSLHLIVGLKVIQKNRLHSQKNNQQ